MAVGSSNRPLAAQPGVARVRGTGPTILNPLPDHYDEADKQPGNGSGNHHQTDKANRAKHDIAHRDLAGDRGLSNRLDDDRAGLGTG